MTCHRIRHVRVQHVLWGVIIAAVVTLPVVLVLIA